MLTVIPVAVTKIIRPLCEAKIRENKMNYNTQTITPEDLLLACIFTNCVTPDGNILISQIRAADLPCIRGMSILPDGVIAVNLKNLTDKQSGRLFITADMKNNLVRFAKENVKSYLADKELDNNNSRFNTSLS
jgi:hypothetical protein